MNFLSKFHTPHLWWVLFGFMGQTVFFMRFLVQWIHSERVGRSIVPVIFWYFSIVGGVISLIYAIHIHDPVFIAGNSIGAFVYTRNLILIYRERKLKRAGV